MIPVARAGSYLASLLVALILQFSMLPDVVANARPVWPLLLLAYWTLRAPQLPNLLAAFVLGLILDVLLVAPLGQHALALVISVYLVGRVRALFAMLPVWQTTLVMIPVWGLYEFVQFWIDGLSHHPAQPLLRWLPVASCTVCWPLVWLVMGLFRTEDSST